MDANRTFARESADEIWRDDVVYGLIVASPMRPGRGRKASPPNGRRDETRVGHEIFRMLVDRLTTGLDTGAKTVDAARREILQAAREEYIRVVETKNHMIEAFEMFHARGLWIAEVDYFDHIVRVDFWTLEQLRRQ